MIIYLLAVAVIGVLFLYVKKNQSTTPSTKETKKEEQQSVVRAIPPLNAAVFGNDLCAAIRATPDETIPITSMYLQKKTEPVTSPEENTIASYVVNRLNAAAPRTPADGDRPLYYLLNVISLTKEQDTEFNTFYTASFVIHDRARGATHALIADVIDPNVSKHGRYIAALFPRQMDQSSDLLR